MTEFTISNEDLVSLKDQVVLITGCASGIGLSTSTLLLELGAYVVGGDVNASPIQHSNFSFMKTDVTSWSALTALFKQAKRLHGRIDHVFANAGIDSRNSWLNQKLDEQGDLIEPSFFVLDINLKAVVNTCMLAVHYQREQASGGSIVLTASASSWQRFRMVDYATAKHGCLGFMRGMVPNIQAQSLPIRINALAPSWTLSGLVSKDAIERAGKRTQPPEAVARSAALVMADTRRNGQMIYSWEGRFKEIDEAILLPAARQIIGDDIDDDTVLERILMSRPGRKTA